MSYIPTSSLSLMTIVYLKIFPAVNAELFKWETLAKQIPNKELRTQALNSIHSKRFHCLGGAVFSLLAGDKWKVALRFIVAYQTISDYLDNLCDRSTSLDPNDFELLHLSMEDAITPGNKGKNYYKLREDQNDGDYLNELVQTCQQALLSIDNMEIIHEQLNRLESMYASLQIHKHVQLNERVPRLTKWFNTNKNKTPTLNWYEFAAATGSTLGLFCIVSYAMAGGMSKELANKIFQSYFPYMQGLHILLDYFIDQKEDLVEGDLNFCSFYKDDEEMKERFVYFIKQTEERIQTLPHLSFHRMVYRGLVGLYLGDEKVKTLHSGEKIKKALLEYSGMTARFFHWNTKMYYKFNKSHRVG
ncbi:tetraprenyl-beta-curcumene synthase family protein [Oceanobacillus sp. Castelsardo]|uniref:tetraprenyl-beta-curcumene synthase family protein n=1 Tax=Oceanobacillus sp. Castelsardo TaxID=1851204 RepID=UPI000B0CA7BE|nr:tetraprenyl-beta-curcumene synthase family protein [Oceanobacillus sp. Castelsardo]